jgi:hypothetical protein
MKREISRFTRLRNPRQVGRRECENRVHHKWMRSCDAQESVASQKSFLVDGMLATYLGIMSDHRVEFEVLLLNISFEMEDKW